MVSVQMSHFLCVNSVFAAAFALYILDFLRLTLAFFMGFLLYLEESLSVKIYYKRVVMDKKKVVVALGHRALGTTLPEQKVAVKASAGYCGFIKLGASVVITHSNAPQVGMIHAAMNEFGKTHEDYTVAPMSVCSAMSQGYIGYDLQNAIRAELIRRGIYRPVSTILTQVTVDPYDEAFYKPSKVVGRVLSEEEADAERVGGNYVVKTEQGYRRIVAAPKATGIIELDTIRALIDADQVVIAAGGGESGSGSG